MASQAAEPLRSRPARSGRGTASGWWGQGRGVVWEAVSRAAAAAPPAGDGEMRSGSGLGWATSDPFMGQISRPATGSEGLRAGRGR